jgi:predicted RNase H-like nuclease (RuvC/YqgF family)
MKEKSVLNKVRELLGMEIKLEERKLDDGITRIEAEEFAPDFQVVIITEDDQKIPMPIGEYKLEDGMILVVQEEGIIFEIKEFIEEEEKVTDEPVAEEVAPEEEVDASNASKSPAKKTVESIVKETFFSEIENLKKENEDLKAEIELLSKETPEVKTELSVETPEAKKITHNPENKKEAGTFLYGQNRPQTTLDRVFEKLSK